MEITITVDGAVSGKYATIVKSALIAYLLYLEKDMEVTLSLDKTGAMATMVIFPGTTFDVSLTDNITAHIAYCQTNSYQRLPSSSLPYSIFKR